MTEWKNGDRFNLSGNAQLDGYSPRVKTSGTIISINKAKTALVSLDTVGDDHNVQATVKLRDLKPVVCGAVTAVMPIKGYFDVTIDNESDDTVSAAAEKLFKDATFKKLCNVTHDRFRIVNKTNTSHTLSTCVHGVFKTSVKPANLKSMLASAERAYEDTNFDELHCVEHGYIDIQTE